VHAAALADELEIPEVIVPPTPGAFSALGLVATDLKRDYSRTLYADLGALDPARVAELLAEMEAAAWDLLVAAGIPPERRVLMRAADVRYRRQAYELTVPVANGSITRASQPHRAGAAGKFEVDGSRSTAPADAGSEFANRPSARTTDRPWKSCVAASAGGLVSRDRFCGLPSALARRPKRRCDLHRSGDHRGDGFDHCYTAWLDRHGRYRRLYSPAQEVSHA